MVSINLRSDSYILLMKSLIYIPLWYLLILYEKGHAQNVRNLHSTMVSINHSCRNCGNACNAIYIPLWYLLILSNYKHLSIVV